MMEGCPFCEVEPERVRLETEVGLAIGDLFPVVRGHILIIPRSHVQSIYNLTASEQAAFWELTREARDLLIEELQPDGFTIGINEGMAAGQSVAHSHVHVIPRFLGDVVDPTGGIRAIFPNRARYWENR